MCQCIFQFVNKFTNSSINLRIRESPRLPRPLFRMFTLLQEKEEAPGSSGGGAPYLPTPRHLSAVNNLNALSPPDSSSDADVLQGSGKTAFRKKTWQKSVCAHLATHSALMRDMQDRSFNLLQGKGHQPVLRCPDRNAQKVKVV